MTDEPYMLVPTDGTGDEAEDVFAEVERFVQAHVGRFTLGLIRANDPVLRDGFVAELRIALEHEGVSLAVLDLSNRHPADLRSALATDTSVKAALVNERGAVAVVGMEHLIEAEADQRTRRTPFASALNLERDGLRQALPAPLLILLTDHAMDRLDLMAPDFFDWYSGVFRLRPNAGGVLTGGRQLPPEVAARIESLERRRTELMRRSTGAESELPSILVAMGAIYVNMPEFHFRQAAVPYLKEAGERYRRNGNKRQVAEVWEQLADVCHWINDFVQARQRLDAALQIYLEIGDRRGEANCHKKIGDVYLQVCEYAQAYESYFNALFVYREFGERTGEANCHKKIGDVHLQIGEYIEADQSYIKALPVYQEFRDRLGEASCQKKLGDTLLHLGKYIEARETYVEALSTYLAVGSRLGEANCQKKMGDVNVRLREYDEAYACYERAHSIYCEIGDRLGEANYNQSLGDLYLRFGREPSTLRQYYRKALGIYMEIGDRLGEANCCFELGRLDDNMDLIEKAMNIHREIGARQDTARDAFYYAKWLLDRGDHARAILLYEQAADQWGQLNLSKYEGMASRELNNALTISAEQQEDAQSVVAPAIVVSAPEASPNEAVRASWIARLRYYFGK